MLKTDPLSWSTLDEATAWLTASTETPWTPRRVLDEVTRITANEVARSHAAAAGAGVALKDYLPSNPYTPLFVAPPPSTEFILQPMPGVHPPGAAPDPMAIPWRMLPLRLDKARQLFASGAVVLLSAGWDEQSAEGRTLFGMELRPPVVATLADIRLHAGALLALLGIATDDEQAATAGPLNESTEPAPAAGAVVRAAPDWQEIAREEAKQIRTDRAKLLGTFPNLGVLGDEVAQIFRSRDITGTNGHALTGAYIKRHALQGHGITSPADKLRSMKKHRGK